MVVIVRARTLADFREVHALIADMGRWDVSQCEARGLQSSGVMSAYYSDDAASLQAKCTLPDTGMYLARVGTDAMGCVGYLGHGDVAEIIKFFVRPEARGKGAGRRLIETALDAIQQSEFRKVNLVTIAFMEDAIALYRRLGFRDCDAFEPAPEGLEEATRYMEMAIG